ncbi:hypothetical protein V6N11_079375 [Hibiscus sabdariffa]|uniref:Uncharacterized protein n=1 Tax=Hibiscus sabdariffa TaxID=183260 RepID=A0ABR2RW14_9ROSI
MYEDKEKRRTRIYGNIESETLWKIVEVGFTDNSSKKVVIGKDRTPQKEKSSSDIEGSSSSESKSPVNGDSQWFQDDQGEVGVGYKTLVAEKENLNEKNKELKDVNQRAYWFRGGGLDKREKDLYSNHSKAPDTINGPSKILEGKKEFDERSLGEKKYPCPPIRETVDEDQRVEQGEDECYSSSDREENWSKAERVFFPELVLKKTTKEVWIIEADPR